MSCLDIGHRDLPWHSLFAVADGFSGRSLFVIFHGGARNWWRHVTPQAVDGRRVYWNSSPLGLVFLPSDPLIYRFAELGAGEEVTANDRVLMWKDTTRLIAAYPLFGCGLGSFESAFPTYGASSPNSTVDFAHNDYLQSLAELGAIGFLVLAALLVAISFKALRTAFQSESIHCRYVGLACSGALSAILLHSVVDFNLYIPANAMVLTWIFGIATGLGETAVTSDE